MTLECHIYRAVQNYIAFKGSQEPRVIAQAKKHESHADHKSHAGHEGQ